MTSKVGRKGQVVLPKAVRERLGIRPGDEVEISDDGEQVAIRKAAPSRPTRGHTADAGHHQRHTRSHEIEHRLEMARDEMHVEEWRHRDAEPRRDDRPWRLRRRTRRSSSRRRD